MLVLMRIIRQKELWKQLVEERKLAERWGLEGAFRLWRKLLPVAQRGQIQLGDAFAHLIQRGLASSDNLSRKQALHMLKAALAAPPGVWLSASLLDTEQWRAFVLLYETLDESTAHLLQPLWHELDRLVCVLTPTATDAQRHAAGSWSAVLLLRALEHQSPVVKQMAVARLMQLDLNAHPLSLPVGSLCRAALRALEELPRERVSLLVSFQQFLIAASPSPSDALVSV